MCSDDALIRADDEEKLIGLNPTLDWICALTHELGYKEVLENRVLILLWTGYVLWPMEAEEAFWSHTPVLILLWTGYVLWQVKFMYFGAVLMGLNPTLDWICALTFWDVLRKSSQFSLNPTLDWICALTLLHWPFWLVAPRVLILLWTGYVLWQDARRLDLQRPNRLNPTLDWICALTSYEEAEKARYEIVLILLWTGYVLWRITMTMKW